MDHGAAIRENYWLKTPGELNNWERLDLSERLIEYLAIPDPEWLSSRQVETMLELHNHLRAWLEDETELD